MIWVKEVLEAMKDMAAELDFESVQGLGFQGFQQLSADEPD